jgi:hypothetical protein
MPKNWSTQNKAEGVSHEDDLLRLLRDLSERDPSPAIRTHLSNVCSQRLQQKRVFPEMQPGTFTWRRAVFATALLAALGLTAASVVHFLYRTGARAPNEPTDVSAPTSTEQAVHASSSALPEFPQLPKHRHSAHTPMPSLSRREMVVRLPYSNNSVDTGTGATIRVSMSQSELLSLGFPLNATLQDRRVVAELTLGDDGLPRAISLPFPLELIKEEK